MERFLKHKLILVTIAIQLVALPLILFAVKQNQETRTQATASTTLSFFPTSSANNPLPVDIGQDFSVDVMVTPSNNIISLAKLEIIYDPTKVTLSPTNPLVVNTAAFSEIIEGPIYTTGKIQLTVAVGFSQAKVIQTETKILTLNLKASAVTNQTIISFGPNNALYSTAFGDSSSDNVLSTTAPSTIKINAAPTPTNMPSPIPTNTPIPTAAPTPTNVPLSVKVTSPNGGETLYVGDTHKITWTNSPTIDKVNIGYSFGPGSLNWIVTNIPNTGSYDWKVGIGNTINTQVKIDITGYHTGIGSVIDQSDSFFTVLPKPTSTPLPTGVPTTPPSPTTGKTVFDIKGLKLHGLGTGGDSPNPTSLGTQNPLHPTRSIAVEIYDASGVLLNSVTGNITFTQNGDFNGSFSAPSTLINGENYLIKVKTPQYKRRQLPGYLVFVKGQENTLASAVLIVGDVNDDNALTVADYDIIMGCYSDLLPAKNCDATKKLKADISDDGKVNYDDYNLFLRELSVQTGD